MNKYLLLFILVSFFSTVDAQNYTVTPNPSSGSADLDTPATEPDDVVAEAHISNNTSDSLFLRWERIENNKPGCWETAVCDPHICYQTSVNTKDFALAPNATGKEMLVHAYPGKEPGGIPTNGAEPGEATVKVKISNLNDPADTLTVVYYFTITGSAIGECTTSISVLEREALKIYPNPTADYFRLTETQEVQQLVVYNILGNQVKVFNVNSNQNYDVNDLPIGIYLVGMLDGDSETLKTVKLQKY